MSDPFIGEIRMFPFGYPPRGWYMCDGTLLQISEHSVLYSVIGTTYGGDGHTTFALPNLQGRAPIHAGDGAGPGLARQQQGDISGIPQVFLYEEQLPAHTHQLQVTPLLANYREPDITMRPATANWTEDSRLQMYAPSDSTYLEEMAGAALKSAGGPDHDVVAPHENRQPYIVIPFCIAMDGVYPQRS